MAFTVQDDTGIVTGANAYVSVADFKTYHDDRGNDYSSYADAALQVAIIKATDYVDVRFQYKGEKQNDWETQTTQWPRINVFDRDGRLVNGIHRAIVEATCEYALLAASTTLEPNPTTDDYGQLVRSRMEKVGPIEQEVRYVAGTLQRPRYPIADQKILKAGLVGNVRLVVRG